MPSTTAITHLRACQLRSDSDVPPSASVVSGATPLSAARGSRTGGFSHLLNPTPDDMHSSTLYSSSVRYDLPAGSSRTGTPGEEQGSWPPRVGSSLPIFSSERSTCSQAGTRYTWRRMSLPILPSPPELSRSPVVPQRVSLPAEAGGRTSSKDAGTKREPVAVEHSRLAACQATAAA